MHIVTIDPLKCVACSHCENACSYHKSGSFRRKDSAIRVNYYPKTRTCIPMTCVHCRDAWCMEVCPAGAISRNASTDAVEIDASRCIGCKMCMLACPFGTMHFDSENKVCMKCDLCGGDPECVKQCISGALTFEAEEDLYRSNRYRIDRQMFSVLKSRSPLTEVRSRNE